MKLFTLQHKVSGRLATFSASSNDGDFCCDVRYSLSEARKGDPIWMVQDRKTAETVAWYNADIDHPENSKAGEWDVVEFENRYVAIVK